MQTTIYATYEHPDEADQAFVELLDQGVSLLDLVVVTRAAYRKPRPGQDDGRLELSELGELEHGCATASSIPPGILKREDLVAVRDPFDETAGGIRLLDNLTYPGDLTECLKKLGFLDQIAQDTENAMLEGGAILILRVPSGRIRDIQAKEVIRKYGGQIVSATHKNSYPE